MLSIQECISKTTDQREKVEDFMDKNGYFDAKECNIYEGLKRSTQRELQETLRKLSLREILFSPGGLTTGYLGTASGVVYLVPTWLSQKLYTASKQQDIVPLISADVFEPRGGDLTVPIGKLTAHLVGEGEVPTSSYTGAGAEITLKKLVVGSVITDEMLEDNQFGLAEWHVQQAGEAMGRLGSNLALDVLKTATDGYGTRVTEAAGAGTTTTLDFQNGVEGVSQYEHTPNTALITREAWQDAVQLAEVTGGAAGDYGLAYARLREPTQGFDMNLRGCDTLFCNLDTLHAAADVAGAAFTKCVTLVFDKNVAMVTARKNWLRIENYANPVEDLAGAVITGRQDSVTVVDEAIAVITET